MISAVLKNVQDGVVFGNHPTRPTQGYVEHAFGFAQLFGEPSPAFEERLADYLLKESAFKPPKIRLYSENTPQWLMGFSACSYRQRFILKKNKHRPSNLKNKDILCVKATSSHLSAIENTFHVTERFWRTQVDFIEQANAFVVFYQGAPASLAYGAAIADARLEIDVLTTLEHRRLGLACGHAPINALCQNIFIPTLGLFHQQRQFHGVGPVLRVSAPKQPLPSIYLGEGQRRNICVK